MSRILLIALLLTPSAALAHGLHEEGSFASGLTHPIGGADHILAMIAVGLLAAQMGGRGLWALPVTFVAAMLGGGLLGASGVGFPAVEPMILASIVILGVIVAVAVKLPLAVVLPVTALFGAAHGWAHGAEGPEAGLALYALGFMLATAALHLVGIAMGRSLGGLVLRGLGAASALAGLALALG